MIIHYKNRTLEKLCNSISEAKKKYGTDVAEKVISTINYIQVANSIVDIINYNSFQFHQLKGDRKGYHTIYLGKRLGYRLIVRPMDSDGNICSNEKIYGANSFEIVNIQVEEVSKHYE